MARIEDIERRLLNWARYWALMEGGGGNFASSDMTQERVDGGGWDAPTVIGTNDAEAEETERAVQSLEPGLEAAVREYYLEGGSIKRRASSVGVSVATLYLRIEQAHRAISNWLSEQARARDEQRRRVEALRVSVRP